MGNYVNIGNAGFAAVMKGPYVDKMEMIAFINSTLGTTDKLTCVSRPRRFGKSYAAKMLCAYYDLQSKVIDEVRESYPQVKKAPTLFETLSNVAETTGNRFIFIIDEWDALFRALFKISLTDKVNYDVKTQKHTCKIEKWERAGEWEGL